MINTLTQKKLFTIQNPSYVEALKYIQQIKNIKSKITTNVWELAVILNKVWKKRLFEKAGFLSYYHFLSAAGLRPNAIMLSIAADVFTEAEFTFLGEGKARIAATAVRTHPDKKDEIMAIAQSSATIKTFREAIEPFVPNKSFDQFEYSFTIKGPKEQIEMIRHIIDVIISTGTINPVPADVIEFSLIEMYNEIKDELGNINIPLIETKLDEITGIIAK